MITGIILAAGASSRMGSPKALLEYRGETFVERLIRTFSTVCDAVIVVLAHHAQEIRPRIEGRARIVLNPDPDRGQLSSLQTALLDLPEHCEGFMFSPVDCPAAELATIQRVADQFLHRDPASQLVIPRYGGKRGHPVCAAMGLAQELLALPATAQAREVIHRHIAETIYIDVDDPGILTDIDHPEAYRRMTEVGR